MLRGTDIPKAGMLSDAALAEVSLSRMIAGEGITVAVLDTQAGLAAYRGKGTVVGLM